MDFQGNLSMTTSNLGTDGWFVNKFPGRLNYTSENFEIGLKEIFLPKDALNHLKEDRLMIHCVKKKIKNLISLPESFTDSHLLNFINTTLTQWKCSVYKVEKVDGKIKFNSKSIDELIFFNRKAADLLGFSYSMDDLSDVKDHEWSNFIRNNVKGEDVEWVISSDKKLKLIDDEFIFIQADCIKHHLLGEKFSQLLAVIPKTNIVKNSIYYHTSKPSYFPIYNNSFDSIKVTFTDKNNNIISFKPNSDLFLLLEVRKSKYYDL